MRNFLNKVLYAKVWELLVMFAIIAALATVYRIYFSRAVALAQVCERLQDLQNDENADAFNSLAGEVGQSAPRGEPHLRNPEAHPGNALIWTHTRSQIKRRVTAPSRSCRNAHSCAYAPAPPRRPQA